MEKWNDEKKVWEIVDLPLFQPVKLDRERLKPYFNQDIIGRFARSMTEKNGELALNYLKHIYIGHVGHVSRADDSFPLMWARQRMELLERMASESPERVESITHGIEKGVYEGMSMVDDSAAKIGYYTVGEVLEEVFNRVLENIKHTIAGQEGRDFAWGIAHEWMDETHENRLHPRKTPIWEYKPLENTNDKEEEVFEKVDVAFEPAKGEENVFEIVDIAFEPVKLDIERLRPYFSQDIIGRFARRMTEKNGEVALNYLRGIYTEKVAEGRENFPLKWARERKELLERMASESPEEVESITHGIEKGVYEGMLMVDDFAAKMGCYYRGEVLEDVYNRVHENVKPTITDEDDARDFAWGIAHEWLDETHSTRRDPRKTPIWEYKPQENTNDKEKVFEIVDIEFEPVKLDIKRLRPYFNRYIIGRFARSMTEKNGKLALNYLKEAYIAYVIAGRENLPLRWARERKELLERMASESPEKMKSLTHGIKQGVHEGMLMVDDSAAKMGYYEVHEVRDDVYDRVLENIKHTITGKDDAENFAWGLAYEWMYETHESSLHPRRVPIWLYERLRFWFGVRIFRALKARLK
jgi:hypothetical protein